MTDRITAALDPEALKAVVVDRVIRVLDSCNSGYSMHQRGVIRGLLWAMFGEDPGNPDDATKILDRIGVPYRTADEDLAIDPEWLRSHGLDVDEEDVEAWEEMKA